MTADQNRLIDRALVALVCCVFATTIYFRFLRGEQELKGVEVTNETGRSLHHVTLTQGGHEPRPVSLGVISPGLGAGYSSPGWKDAGIVWVTFLPEGMPSQTLRVQTGLKPKADDDPVLAITYRDEVFRLEKR
jgi:hypothetical protein